jgi:hypothetical protein
MPRKIAANDPATPSVRAAKPKTPKTAPVVSTPRVKSAKHKTDAPVAAVEIETVIVNAHGQIAKIAYGYWEARGFEPGSPEEDWLRAEQEFLLTA